MWELDGFNFFISSFFTNLIVLNWNCGLICGLTPAENVLQKIFHAAVVIMCECVCNVHHHSIFLHDIFGQFLWSFTWKIQYFRSEVGYLPSWVMKTYVRWKLKRLQMNNAVGLLNFLFHCSCVCNRSYAWIASKLWALCNFNRFCFFLCKLKHDTHTHCNFVSHILFSLFFRALRLQRNIISCILKHKN